MNRFLRIHGPTLFWAALIFTFSSIPNLKPPDVEISLQDKMVHLLEFLVLGFLLRRSFRQIWGDRFSVILLTVAVGTLYGGLDEIHQSFVEGREASYGDFYADTLGIMLGHIVFWAENRINLF